MFLIRTTTFKAGQDELVQNKNRFFSFLEVLVEIQNKVGLLNFR
jgi:hypothetical protein